MRTLPVLLLALIGTAAQDPDVEILIQQLGDDSIEVREKATAVLSALGGKVEDRLKAKLGPAQGVQRTQIESLLQSIRRRRNFEAVLAPVKKVTLVAQDKPWKEFATEFHRQTGWPLNLESIPDRSVTLNIKDAAPFEALDALCRAGQTGYRIESVRYFKSLLDETEEGKGFKPDSMDNDRPGIEFSYDQSSPGPRIYTRQYSVALGGIAVTKLNDFKAPYSTGLVSLRLLWPPSAQPESLREFRVFSILDDKKRDLSEPIPKSDDAQSRDLRLDREYPLLIHFKHPEADAKTVSIKGRACFRYPVDEVLITFPAPKAAVGKKESQDGVEICLKEYRKENDDIVATLEVSGMRTRPLSGKLGGFVRDGKKLGFDTKCVRLRTEGREELNQVDGHIFEPASRPDIRLVYLKYVGIKSEVLAIEIVMDRVYQEDAFEFEFKDVDLPK
jgi:hypothetical protein